MAKKALDKQQVLEERWGAEESTLEDRAAVPVAATMKLASPISTELDGRPNYPLNPNHIYNSEIPKILDGVDPLDAELTVNRVFTEIINNSEVLRLSVPEEATNTQPGTVMLASQPGAALNRGVIPFTVINMETRSGPLNLSAFEFMTQGDWLVINATAVDAERMLSLPPGTWTGFSNQFTISARRHGASANAITQDVRKRTTGEIWSRASHGTSQAPAIMPPERWTQWELRPTMADITPYFVTKSDFEKEIESLDPLPQKATESEAKAGTETSARTWSPYRVFQAAKAAMAEALNALTGLIYALTARVGQVETAANNAIPLSNIGAATGGIVPLARGGLGAGTAAGGRGTLEVPRAMGGGFVTNANIPLEPGFYGIANGAAGVPAGAPGATLINARWDANSQGQISIHNGRAWLRGGVGTLTPPWSELARLDANGAFMGATRVQVVDVASTQYAPASATFAFVPTILLVTRTQSGAPLFTPGIGFTTHMGISNVATLPEGGLLIVSGAGIRVDAVSGASVTATSNSSVGIFRFVALA